MNGKLNYETNTGNFSFFISLNFIFQGFSKGTIVFFSFNCKLVSFIAKSLNIQWKEYVNFLKQNLKINLQNVMLKYGICHILLCAVAPWSSRAERGGLNFVDPEK